MLKRLYAGLLAVAKRIGQVQAWIIFTLLYFVLLAPVALLHRLLTDPLHLRSSARSIWHTRPAVRDPLAWAKEQ